ncbi:winged helix-turn-helix transcriptional regulator [Vibrio sp. JPW-9-11-11]|uniref:ArsR/SmtB family transcription factor n=1 Tax=Vibrio sp. JPW-9-11-11 TaxID=1416532 RepID=UPI001593E4B7|nr:winged helix-turn-helix domain-containing protein [Vibrio sp. JPW-9-11-11]NVD07811.1 winged helix-turn-helix transcriptional regulator [Vibrio sp. JPW-9-11-11]
MSGCDNQNLTTLTLTDTQLEQQHAFAMQAKALSHPVRVRIVKILIDLDQQGGCLNHDIVGQLGLAQSTVSEHLRVLKSAGFINAHQMPPKVCYRINQAALTQFKQLFSDVFH